MIVTRKGAVIYKFRGESEFESGCVALIFCVTSKKKCVKICWTEEAAIIII